MHGDEVPLAASSEPSASDSASAVNDLVVQSGASDPPADWLCGVPSGHNSSHRGSEEMFHIHIYRIISYVCIRRGAEDR